MYVCQMVEKIQSLAKQYAPDFIQVRRHLHANPELSYQEFKTAAFVKEQLAALNIPFEKSSNRCYWVDQREKPG